MVILNSDFQVAICFNVFQKIKQEEVMIIGRHFNNQSGSQLRLILSSQLKQWIQSLSFIQLQFPVNKYQHNFQKILKASPASPTPISNSPADFFKPHPKKENIKFLCCETNLFHLHARYFTISPLTQPSWGKEQQQMEQPSIYFFSFFFSIGVQ